MAAGVPCMLVLSVVIWRGLSVLVRISIHIWDKTTQHKLLEIITNADGTSMSETDKQAAWDAFLKKPEECNPLFLEETLF